MKILQETTTWTSSSTPNNIYVLTDDRSKMIAYVPHGTVTVIKFSKPINFDVRGRQFKAVE